MFAYYKRQDNSCLPYMRDEIRKQKTTARKEENEKLQDDETRAPATKTDDTRCREQATRLSQQENTKYVRGKTQEEEEEEEEARTSSRPPHANHMPKLLKNNQSKPTLTKTKVRTNPTARPQARRTKWFDPQVWWHSISVVGCLLLLLLLLLICAFTASVSCEETSAIGSTSGASAEQQAQISSHDYTQQKVSEETLGALGGIDPSHDASGIKTTADAGANISEQSAETSQQAGDSSASAAPATNSPAPSDLDSVAATAANLQQQQQQQQPTVQQQLEEIPASVPTAQDVAQDPQQPEQVSGASNDQQQQQQQEQQTRTITAPSSNYENDLLPVSQYGGETFGKKQHPSGESSSSQRVRDAHTKSSRSLKRAFGGARMGVFGRKRPHQLPRQQQQQQQQDQLTTTHADSNVNTSEQARPKNQAHHHHYYYQTVQQQKQEAQQGAATTSSGGKQRQQLKQADYPDYKEILVQPDNLGDREYEVQRQAGVGVDVARGQQTTITTSSPVVEQQTAKFEQDKVGVGDTDGAPTESTITHEQQATTNAAGSDAAADHSGFEVQQGGQAAATAGEPTNNSQMPYIRLSNIATINSTTSTSGSNSSTTHGTSAGEMKLMRIYVIDLDQKLVVGGGGGGGGDGGDSADQNTYSPVASVLDSTSTGATSSTPAPSKTNSEQQQQQQQLQVSEHVEQVKVDSDSLEHQQQQQPYSESAAHSMQTQQSSTVYATTGVPQAAEADSTAPATESNLSHDNYTSSGDTGIQAGRRNHQTPEDSNYTGPQYAGSNYSQPHQQVVVVSDDYQKYAQQQQQQTGAPAGKQNHGGEFVYVDRDSLQANLSQIMAQMAHNTYTSPIPGATHSSVGHFYHYPNHMLMTMSHQQPQPQQQQQQQNYSLVGNAHPAGQQYYASNHQQVNYEPSPPQPENLVYLNPNPNNGTQLHYTNERNQYLGKSARAAEPPTAPQADYNWSQPATTGDRSQASQPYNLQSLSVAYPSFIQQQAAGGGGGGGGGGGQFAAVYPAAPMQHHQVQQQQQQQQPLVMSVPQYIAPQYAPVAARPAQNYSAGKSTGPAHDTTTTGHAMMIVPLQQQQQQPQPPTVSIYKQQQLVAIAQDSPEQYSTPGPLEWHTAEGHPSSSSSSSSSSSGAYNTQQQAAKDTNYKQSSGPDPADKYQLPANKSASHHLYVYSQQQQQQQQQPAAAAEYLMYQQAQQQQHPISAAGVYPQAAQTSEPGQQQQQQQHYYSAQAQAQVDPYGAGGKVTTQQSDHWKPVDFASPATSSLGRVNFYPLKSGAGQQATGGPAHQSNSMLLYGYSSGQPDHDIVSLSARQQQHQQQQQQQQRALYSAVGAAANSSQPLTPTAAKLLMLGAGYVGEPTAAANTSAPLDSEHAHLGNYRPMAYVNSLISAVELAPSQQVHAHPSFSPSSTSSPSPYPLAFQYNGTARGLGSQISSQQNVEAYQASSGAGQPQPQHQQQQQQHQIGVTNEYASLPPQQAASYTSKRYKQANSSSEQTSEEAPSIPHAHSSLTSTATAAGSSGHRRPSGTSGSYGQQEAEAVEQQQQQQEDSGYDSPTEPADYTKTANAGTKGHALKYANDGQKSPAAARPHKAPRLAGKKQQVKPVKQSDDILHQYAEPDQLSLQQAAQQQQQQQQQQQVAGELSSSGGGGAQQELLYGGGGGGGQQQTRHPGRPYMVADSSPYVAPGAAGAPPYGNLMLRQPVAPAYYRAQATHQNAAPTKGLLSWETISSVASGAAKRIPGALSSFLSPFKYQQQQQQHPVYNTANSHGAQHLQHHLQLQYPKSAHYAGDVANFHRPYPFSHMSHPQSYSDSTGSNSHATSIDLSEHQQDDSVEESSAHGGEEEEVEKEKEKEKEKEEEAGAAANGESDLSGASSSSSAASSSSGEQSGDSHTLNVTSHAHQEPASSAGINITEIIGDPAEISPGGGRRPSSAKRRPIHGASTGSKSKGTGPKRPTGAKPKELDSAQVAVLSSIEHELASQHAHKPASKGHKRKPGSKKTRPQVSVSTADDDLTKTTPLVDPTILAAAAAAAAHSGGSIHLDSLPLDQQRLLLGKMAGAHNGLASYMKQATPPGAIIFPLPEATATALGSGPLPAHMMTIGGHSRPGAGPQLNAVQIGQYKIVPQTQFVQSIIEPSRQMLGQYFRQYLGQLNQFAAG